MRLIAFCGKPSRPCCIAPSPWLQPRLLKRRSLAHAHLLCWWMCGLCCRPYHHRSRTVKPLLWLPLLKSMLGNMMRSPPLPARLATTMATPAPRQRRCPGVHHPHAGQVVDCMAALGGGTTSSHCLHWPLVDLKASAASDSRPM